MNEGNSPAIGVSWVTPGHKKSARYLDAVRLAGGRPVALPANASSWDGEQNGIRGLLLTGGGDVDPARYGEENLGSRGINPHRDELESRALSHCLERGLPVLAICRGLQFVNVALGGSLIQDIDSPVKHGPTGEDSSYHEIEIVPASRLAELADDRILLTVNSRHHQGVDRSRLAPRLRVTALATDGIVEGFELPEYPFLVAVQCHPEYLDQVPALSGLFHALVSQAARS